MNMVWNRSCPGPLANWLWWDGWVITFLESDANGLLLHPYAKKEDEPGLRVGLELADGS